MQRFFSAVKITKKFIGKIWILLTFNNIFAENIDCGYTLESPRQGGSNKYSQSMFWVKNKKNTCRYIPAYPSFTVKSGV